MWTFKIPFCYSYVFPIHNNFDKITTTDSPENLTILCKIRILHKFCRLRWQFLPIMQALFSRLLPLYYDQNYAGIIGSNLPTAMLWCVVVAAMQHLTSKIRYSYVLKYISRSARMPYTNIQHKMLTSKSWQIINFCIFDENFDKDGLKSWLLLSNVNNILTIKFIAEFVNTFCHQIYARTCQLVLLYNGTKKSCKCFNIKFYQFYFQLCQPWPRKDFSKFRSNT